MRAGGLYAGVAELGAAERRLPLAPPAGQPPPPQQQQPGAALLPSALLRRKRPAAALQGELSRSLAGGAGALGEAVAGEEAAFWSLLSSAQAEAAAAKRSGDAIDLMAGGFDLATG